MLLLATEWPDGAVRLVSARNVSDGIAKATEDRNGERPSYVWVLSSERRPVFPPD